MRGAAVMSLSGDLVERFTYWVVQGFRLSALPCCVRGQTPPIKIERTSLLKRRGQQGNVYQAHPLRANISETVLVLLINEQGEKEKGRDEQYLSWCSSLWGFGWRGTERRRAKRAAA